jgi:hypothetical protein
MVTLIVVVIVVGAAAITIRSVWKHRHAAPIGGRGLDRVEQPEVDGQGYYAPSFIVVPGQCFRLCRDGDTGTAFPCENPVEGSGNFHDHRGNPVMVESCGAHRSSLTNWEFRQLR